MMNNSDTETKQLVHTMQEYEIPFHTFGMEFNSIEEYNAYQEMRRVQMYGPNYREKFDNR